MLRNRRFVRRLFLVAALWNALAAGAALAVPMKVRELTYGRAGVSDDLVARLATTDFAVCVLLFGLGYALVALDPARNQGLIVVGIVGKLGVVLGFSDRFLTGQATAFILLPVAVDGLFAALFLYVLAAGREA